MKIYLLQDDFGNVESIYDSEKMKFKIFHATSEKGIIRWIKKIAYDQDFLIAKKKPVIDYQLMTVTIYVYQTWEDESEARAFTCGLIISENINDNSANQPHIGRDI